jgi:uncharacterized protein
MQSGRPVPRHGFARDFGVAALVAIPLAIGVGVFWVQEVASDHVVETPLPITLALGPSGEAVEAEAIAQAPPVAPFFGIRPNTTPSPVVASIAAPVAVAAPARAPTPPIPTARASDAGWEARAVRPPQVRAGAWIAIVIDDLGADRARSARAAALPGPLTLSYLSYAPDIADQARQSRAAGHEILLHLPMEPEGRDNPGPGALFVRMASDDIRARTANALDALPLAVGLNNHMGSRFTRDAQAITPVLQEIAARGLLFVDSRTSGGSVAGQVATAMGVANAGRDIFLDNEIDGTSVRKQLAELERTANRRGHAIAIGHPHEATLDALAAWIPTMNSRGLQLVPVSAIVRQQRLVATLANGSDRVETAEAARPVPVRAAAVAPSRAEPEPSRPFVGAAPWKGFPSE